MSENKGLNYKVVVFDHNGDVIVEFDYESCDISYTMRDCANALFDAYSWVSTALIPHNDDNGAGAE